LGKISDFGGWARNDILNQVFS